MRDIFHMCCIQSLALGICISLASCGDKTGQAAGKPPTSEAVGNAKIPDTHKSIITTFGIAANATPENLLEAAIRLNRIGATPMASEGDYAHKWQEKALSLKPDLVDGILPFRGRVKGPAYREHELAPGETETLREIFYAAEKANLSLDPRRLPLTLGVSEVGETKPVCSFSSTSEIISCEWVPIYTAPYNITITNMGNTPVTYLLISN